MKPELTIIPQLKIHPDKIITYNNYHWSPQKSHSDNPTLGQLFGKPKHDHLLSSSRSAGGKLSKTALKKMGMAVDYLVALAQPKKAQNLYTGKDFQFKLAFITLTLSSKQKHPDNVIKDKLLDSFLIEIGKKYKVDRYVWRAEKQKNGNIHFHILIDKFVPWSELRDRWNRIQNKLGYVDSYRIALHKHHKNGFKLRPELLKKWDAKKQYEAYKAGLKTDWHNPNSTDIHSLKKINNVKAYVKKYVSKTDPEITIINEQILKLKKKQRLDKLKGTNKKKVRLSRKLQIKLRRKLSKLSVKGRVWGCSQSLSNISGLVLEVDNKVSQVVQAIKDLPQIHRFEDSYFTIYYIDINSFNNRHTKFIYDLFLGYLHDSFDIPVNLELALTG